MDQRSPQNIEELLQQLKTTVDQTQDLSDSQPVEKGKRVSDAKMQEELKKRFMDSSYIYDAKEEEDNYALDDDFLRELNADAAKKKSPSRTRQPKPIEELVEIVEEPIVEEAIVEEAIVEEAIVEEPIVEELIVEEPTVEESIVEEPIVEEAIVEEAIVEEAIVEETIVEEAIVEEAIVEEEIAAEPLEVPLWGPPITSESLQEEADDTAIEEPIMHTINLSALGVSEKEKDLSDQTDNETASVEESLADIDLMFETAAPTKREADPSIVDLLLQFGCDDELEETVEEESISEYFCEEGNDVPLDPTASYAYDGKEYRNAKQTESLQRKYHSLFVISLCRMVLVAVLAVLVLLYDLLPLYSIEFPGIFDYEIYPVAYVLLGLQLLLVCCLPVLKNMWHGLRSLWQFRAGPYTAAAASVIFVALYDLTSLAMSDRLMPSVFHFISAFTILMATVCDHLLLCRERSVFRVYSAGGSAYTLLKSDGKGSIAEKMRGGGLPNGYTVRMPADVTFPNCYFRSVCEETSRRSVMRFLLVPTVLASVLCGVVGIFLGRTLFSSLSGIFVLLLAALPSSAALVDSIVQYVAAVKLEHKGCAIAGKGAIERYANTNVLAFWDRHLFAPCRSEDVGMVLYDQTNAEQAMASLKALYARVGGPMASVLENVPSAYSADDVKIIRMFRNGIEAVIARRHVLIVGDRTFMERYGLDFSDTDREPRGKGRATLCVSFDGAKSMKLNVKYRLEPLFEVLVERLADEHVYCAVETQDPLINSRMASQLRSRGNTPIGIVHKTSKDLQRTFHAEQEIRKEPTGILAHRSRLRLSELVIFCKRLRAFNRNMTLCTVIGGALTFAIAAACILTGYGDWVTQYLLLLCHTVTSAVMLGVGLCSLPPKGYISLVSYDRDYGDDRVDAYNKK